VEKGETSFRVTKTPISEIPPDTEQMALALQAYGLSPHAADAFGTLVVGVFGDYIHRQTHPNNPSRWTRALDVVEWFQNPIPRLIGTLPYPVMT
jgi:hypothetical protein